MSLRDALLLEEPAPPRSAQPSSFLANDIHIALRTDGQKGSGTANDPYNGGVKLDQAKPCRLAWTAPGGIDSRALITASTDTPHGLQIGEIIVISEADDNGGELNGTFVVAAATSTSFNYRVVSPAPGGVVAATFARVIFLFDEVMRNVPSFAKVQIGPGTFETRGFSGSDIVSVPFAWNARTGQKIRGTGRGLTILRLSKTVDGVHGIAIGNGYGSDSATVDNFELDDLTVDSNIQSQTTDAVTKHSAVALGSHIRYRHLAVHDFATHTDAECFPVSIGGARQNSDPRNAGYIDARLDDVVVTRPNPSGNYVSSLLSVGSGEYGEGSPRYGRAGAIRNCYIDGDFADERAVAIDSIVYDAGVALVTTKAPHLREVGEWIAISGVLDNGVLSNSYNGSFKISALESDTAFEFVPNTNPGPNTDPTGEMFVGRWTWQPVPVARIQVDPVDATIAVLESHTPHNLKPGDTFQVYSGTGRISTGLRFFGWRRVLEESANGVLSPTKLRYRIPTVAEEPAEVIGRMFLGAACQGISAEGATETVVEGNRIFGAVKGGSYHDTWNGKDITMRNNFYSSVFVGPMNFFERGHTAAFAWLKSARLAQSSLFNESGLRVTFQARETASLPSVADAVRIRGALAYNGAYTSYFNPYNGKVVVTARGPTTFSYDVTQVFQDCGSTPVFEAWLGEKVKTGCSIRRKAQDGPDAGTAVFSTLHPHGLTTDSSVHIAGATVKSGLNPYNTSSEPKTVAAVSTDTFEYTLSSTAVDASGSPVFGTNQSAASLTAVNLLATFTTALPTGLFAGQIVKISGATPAAYNGIFRITAIPSATTFQYVLDADPGGSGSGAAFTVFLPVASIALIANQWWNHQRVAIVSSDGPHRLRTGDLVSIWGATVSDGENPYNTAFRVERIISATEFWIVLEGAPTASAGGTIYWATQNSSPLVRRKVGDKVMATYTTDCPVEPGELLFNVLAERCLVTIFNAALQLAPNAAEPSTFFNPYNNVVEVGSCDNRSFTFSLVDPALGIGIGDPVPIGAPELGHAGGNPLFAIAEATPIVMKGRTATFRTVYHHGLEIGQNVRIEDPVRQSADGAGTFRITAIPDERSFSWEYSTGVGQNGTPGSTYFPFWRVIRHVMENNTIELTNPAYPDDEPNLRNIAMQELGDVRRVNISENSFRVLPGTDYPPAAAILNFGLEALLVQKNVIENFSEPEDPYWDGTVFKRVYDSAPAIATYFGNVNSDAEEVPGYRWNGNSEFHRHPDFSDKANEILITTL